MFTTKLQFASLMFFNFREEVHVAQVKLVLLHGSLHWHLSKSHSL